MIRTVLGSVTAVMGRIPILDVEPVVEEGRRPAKAVTGETFQVSATVFRDGHGIIGTGVVLRDPGRNPGPVTLMRELAPGTDRYGADVTVTCEGLWRFHVEAWADPIASWHHDAAIKIPAGQDVELMLTEGALLFERAVRRIPQPPGASRNAAARAALRALIAMMRDPGLTPAERLAATEHPAIAAVLAAWPLRDLLTRSPSLTVQVDRERALYGSWYEFFPRSEGVQFDPAGRKPPVSGTLGTAAKRLDAMLSPGEQQRVIAAHASFAAQSRQLHDQLRAALESQLPAGHPDWMDKGPQNGAMQPPQLDAGTLLLMALSPHPMMDGMHGGMMRMEGAPPQ